MKVSIITVCYNSETTIADTIQSVAAQNYHDKEHIIVDGNSTDRTMAVVQSYAPLFAHVISEPDKGIYDAMNKGIVQATGDIVGILNADDMYFDAACLSAVVKQFNKKEVAAVCGNVVYVDPADVNRYVRFYPSNGFAPWMFSFGMMPPHPAFFVQRHYYETFGLYKIDYKIAADFELLLRFFKSAAISYTCLPRTLVKMRTGGVSTRNLKSTLLLNKEVLRACRENNLQSSVVHILAKYGIKLFQLLQRPS